MNKLVDYGSDSEEEHLPIEESTYEELETDNDLFDEG